VPPANVQSTVASEGAKGHVVTALSFNAGSVDLFSYSWNRAGNAAYDTDVMSVGLAEIGTAATDLASSGYVITAVGGNPTNGFLVVGTKEHGSTTPHTVLVVADQTGPPPSQAVVTQLFQNGYAVVALLQQLNAGTVSYTWIGEK
jgi:hypothetical protein